MIGSSNCLGTLQAAVQLLCLILTLQINWSKIQ